MEDGLKKDGFDFLHKIGHLIYSFDIDEDYFDRTFEEMRGDFPVLKLKRQPHLKILEYPIGPKELKEVYG